MCKKDTKVDEDYGDGEKKAKSRTEPKPNAWLEVPGRQKRGKRGHNQMKMKM